MIRRPAIYRPALDMADAVFKNQVSRTYETINIIYILYDEQEDKIYIFTWLLAYSTFMS